MVPSSTHVGPAACGLLAGCLRACETVALSHSCCLTHTSCCSSLITCHTGGMTQPAADLATELPTTTQPPATLPGGWEDPMAAGAAAALEQLAAAGGPGGGSDQLTHYDDELDYHECMLPLVRMIERATELDREGQVGGVWFGAD